MSFRINHDECKYYVDKEQRKVVCVIPNTMYAFEDLVYDNFNLKIKNIPNYLVREMMLPKYFRGVATCHEDDKFDEKVGKLIAYNKARRKLNISIFKRLNIYLRAIDKEMNKIIDDCNYWGKRLEKANDAREKRIKMYLSEE